MYELVHAERARISVVRACRTLEVSRSGYYKWLHAVPSARAEADRQLESRVVEIHKEHSGRYGSPRIHRELRDQGEKVGRKRIARLMRQAGISGYTRRRSRRTTDSRHSERIAPNLLQRDFSAPAVNQVWVGDITYIPSSDGWLYLAVLLDLFSRRVVGHATSDRIDTDLALSALRMAVESRAPEPGLIHHTDRDCRYASSDYREELKRHHMVASMSGKGDCWDNAVAESFFATLEKESLSHNPLASNALTATRVRSYIDDYYNARRRHSFINYVTPIEHELLVA